MEALQRLQNRAFDIIDSSSFKGSWERRSLNVNKVMNFDHSLMTYKIVNNRCPEILQNKIQERSSISKCHTRNKGGLHSQRLSLECVKKSFFHTWARHGIVFHNPSKRLGQYSHSKKRLKTHYLS